ncbi:MAG TPA: low-specificity L-threonine aldolase [Acidobacteriota bacterium]|nr:low-specificity L-threonine aldolase [Acidobacteriota bacterium]
MPIDLRSDTVTKPTAEMREAMAAAEVGDDVYLEDPTINRLQERAAAIFQREAALFVPSGTMGNQIAVRIHTNPGQEVITEERGHIYNYEMAAMAAISGVLARPISAPDGILSWDAIRPAIRPKIYYRAQTGLITLENTHNMAGGTVYTKDQIEDICENAHAAGLPVHMDGARIFNAATALGGDVASLTRGCDSVMFCLSKGLAAPVGSMVVGSSNFIEKARSVRKMMGGGMRQAGVLAAAGLIALEKMPSRLCEDHQNARALAERLAQIRSLDVDPSKVRTNIVIVGIARTGFGSSRLASLLKERDVLVGTVDAATIRLLTHVDVNRKDVVAAADAFDQILKTAKP